MVCEIKNVENKKSSFTRIKDFFKEKFDKKVVKEKIKKVVAGGLIATSLFLSRPVMAENTFPDKKEMQQYIQVNTVEGEQNDLVLKGIAKNGIYSYEAHEFYWKVKLEPDCITNVGGSKQSYEGNIYRISSTNDKNSIVVVTNAGDNLYARVCPAENIINEVAALYYPPVYYSKFEEYTWNNPYQHIENITDALNNGCQDIPFGINTNSILKVTGILNGNIIFVVNHREGTFWSKEGYFANAYRFEKQKNGKFKLKKVDDFYIGKNIEGIDEEFSTLTFYVKSTECNKKEEGTLSNCAESLKIISDERGALKKESLSPHEVPFTLSINNVTFGTYSILNVWLDDKSEKVNIKADSVFGEITYQLPLDFFLQNYKKDKYGDIIGAFLLSQSNIPDRYIVFITHNNENKISGIVCDGYSFVRSLSAGLNEVNDYPIILENNKYAELYKKIYWQIILKNHKKYESRKSCYFIPTNEILNSESILDVTLKNRLIYIKDKSSNIHVYSINADDSINENWKLRKVGIFSPKELDEIGARMIYFDPLSEINYGW